jgi:hypothetical protein
MDGSLNQELVGHDDGSIPTARLLISSLCKLYGKFGMSVTSRCFQNKHALPHEIFEKIKRKPSLSVWVNARRVRNSFLLDFLVKIILVFSLFIEDCFRFV